MVRRNKKIQTIVSKLLSDSLTYLPAIDVEKIAANQNIQVRREDLKDVSGLIYRDGNQVIIGINGKDVENRQRFTIAHELGHFFLHAQNTLLIDKASDIGFTRMMRNQVSSQAVNLDEIEANSFAAELLMPSHMVFDEIKKIHNLPEYADDDLDNIITHLANRFKVSKDAMMYRLSNLGLLHY